MSPKIKSLEKMVQDVPAMPVVAQKVMDMLGDPRVTNTMLGETLASDQSLASRILQMANSPFFGTRQKIGSIGAAIFVLGHAALRSVIIAVCTKGLLKSPRTMEKKLWEHALGTAVAARSIAEKTKLQDPDEAFIAGLLHDIGKTSLAVVYPEEYRALFMKILEADGMDARERLALEKEEFDYDHCKIGSSVLLAWRLPNLFSSVARRHHTDNLGLIKHEDAQQAICIAAQANLIAARVGFGRNKPDRAVDVIATPFNEALKIDREATLKIIETTLTTYAEARDQFSLR